MVGPGRERPEPAEARLALRAESARSSLIRPACAAWAV